MIPEKLKQGDEIRIIAPSRSLALLSQENKDLATKKLEELGFKVTFGFNVDEKDEFISSSIESRVKDIHDAFSDKNVKAILTVIGGFNCNQLLSYLDYDLIKNNPKIFCGYSDITALQNTFLKKSDLVTYSGPHFSTFAMKNGFEFTLDSFKKCLMSSEPVEIIASENWSDDSWWENQEDRNFIQNNGFLNINSGEAEGTLVGGNICTLNLLQGTEFMPSLENSILFIEDDEESKAVNFDRDLQSLIHLPEFKGVKGIVIGRFQKASKVTDDLLIKIIKTKKELSNIPVIANVDFGHTMPLITFPIGGKVRISDGKLLLLEH
ncbi:LD-carboxypeptidase [Candidatus Woesearchaeota archaeon]|jgi:muramoyltetrapeptide carboxypeptidase|nr:LD-carboxypeptidase [Candidatus Woesearchaeota archaeon]MBT4368626.1 LD-carboxypeptidase [Candidatus Woesearchaeota archaeon]MBT4713065.1 LD-carboxypeptidase [Candidatus Woesearchaeota archaeon]MBT6638987.1 LD-carboxypeptidase [Candidatus Woesearchaeota archaeon]MBT7134186.1 LD-carboxypeptidase [Candidatus Woesearchaeota archaeon]